MYNIDSSQGEHKTKEDEHMTRTELLAKLDKVKTAIFINEMADHWSYWDREERAKLEREKREILKALETAED